MFKVKGHKAIIKDLHIIANNKIILYNDRNNDILFTGTNKYGNRLIVCIMFEDDENDFLRYIHVLVNERQYVDFLNKEITLLNILHENENFFITDYDYSMNILDYNLVSIDDVPEEFLPLKNSYCPDFIKQSSFSYSVSMQGGLADLHKAEAEDLSNVSNKFSDLLKVATNFFEDINYNRKIYVEALETGSFKINFKVEIIEPDQTGIVNVDEDDINSFLNDYFTYFFNDLPEENDNLFEHTTINSVKFKELEAKMEHLYAESFTIPQGGVEQKLIDLINYSANSLRTLNYSESFTSLKFENITQEGSTIPFAIIDETFIPSIEGIVNDVERFHAEDIIEIDDTPQDYNIRIYNFSTISGKGSGFYINPDGVQRKIIVHAKGRGNYENTIFTKSMDEGKPFVFRSIGTRKNGVLRKVVYTYQ